MNPAPFFSHALFTLAGALALAAIGGCDAPSDADEVDEVDEVADEVNERDLILICLNAQTVSPGAVGTTPISAALSKACTNGTITLNPGTYREVLAIGKNITLQGAINAPLPVLTNYLPLFNQTPPASLITVSGAAQMTLRRLSLAPLGTRGLLGVETGAGAPTVSFQNSTVTGGKTGVDGVYHKFAADHTAFSGSASHCVHAFADDVPGSSVSFKYSTADGCGFHGLLGYGFEDGSYLYNKATNIAAGIGIASYFADHVAVQNNEVSTSQYGILVSLAAGGYVQDNKLDHSGIADLRIAASDDLAIVGNTASLSKYRGIEISGSHGLYVDSNKIIAPKEAGLYLSLSSDVDISYSVISGGTPSMYVEFGDTISSFHDRIQSGHIAGLELRGTSGFTGDFLEVTGTHKDTVDGTFGDGVTMDDSSAVFNYSKVEYSDRAGFSAFNGSQIGMNSGLVRCAKILFDQESGSHYEQGQQSTICLDCQGQAIQCAVASQNLTTPGALPTLQSSSPS